jgi:sporulation protein YlmC with PRC-barrel domain
MKYTLTLLLLALTFWVSGQNLISPITITLPAKPPANTADWANAVPPVMIMAQTKPVNGGIDGMVIESKILVTIKSGGNKICGSYTPQSAPNAGFNSLTKSWNGANVVSFLGQDCSLKPGSYELCVQFYNYETKLIGEACKPFTIADNKDVSYSPPNNVMPLDKKEFTEKELLTPITFRWTPIIPKPQDPIVYRLRVWQLMTEKGNTSVKALMTTDPIFEKDVENTTQIMERIVFPCKPCRYIWNIEALSKNGNTGDLKSVGMSAPTSFAIAGTSCGTNTSDAVLECDKMVEGVQTFKGTIIFKNVATGNTPTCNSILNTIASNTGSITSLTTLPVTIPANGNVTVTFIYAPSSSTANTALFKHAGGWLNGTNQGFQINNFDVPIPQCGVNEDCCKGSSWKTKSINWAGLKDAFSEGIIPQNNNGGAKSSNKKIPIKDVNVEQLQMPATSINIDCNKEYHLSQGGTYTFNASYNCATKECTSRVKVKIKGVSDVTLDGNYNAGVAKIFTTPGTYQIEYISYCGDQTCNKCSFTIIIDKDCCGGSKWRKAQYQIVNKKADGTEDNSDTKVYDIPLTISSGVPVIKTDASINISSLDFQCASQEGCPVSYKIKRKNMTTGKFDQEVILSGGNNTITLAAKTYPQYITIHPSCGGKICGNVLIFKLECLNKNCISSCSPNRSLNINTGIDLAGNALLINTADAQWSGHYTLPNAPNASYTCKALIPEKNNPDYKGDFTVQRNINICKAGTFSINGVVRCDKLLSLQLIDANNNAVWTAAGLPTTNYNFNTPFNFNANINLGQGLLKLVATYSTRLIGVAGYSYPIGFSLCGSITTSNGELNNNNIACCNTAINVSQTQQVDNDFNCPTGFIKINGVCEPEIKEIEGRQVWTMCSGGKIECVTRAEESDSWTKTTNATLCASNGKECSGNWSNVRTIEDIIIIKDDNNTGGSNQLPSKSKIINLLSPSLKKGSIVQQIMISKTTEGTYQLLALAMNKDLKLVQTIVADLEEQKDGSLQLANNLNVTTQSMLPAQSKGASPGGGKCSACGAVFTDEQKLITHTESCEITSVSSKVKASKQQKLIGHVTLLR